MKEIILLLLVCIQTTVLDLRIGTTVSREDIKSFSTENLILHNGDLKPSINKEIDGVTYRIAYNPDNYKIIQISTYDDNFQTQDGFKVNSFIEAKKEQLLLTSRGEILGPKTIDGWTTILSTEYEITIMRNGTEEEIDLSDGKFSIKSAKKGIEKLFMSSDKILIKIERFSKID